MTTSLRMRHQLQFQLGESFRISAADLTDPGFSRHRTAPTKDQVLVPETLLKKRKSQEKAREQSLAEREKRKKVGYTSLVHSRMVQQLLVMENTTKATRLKGQCRRQH